MEISLTKGKVAIIDDADFELISQYKWYAQIIRNEYTYAASADFSSGKRKRIYMHRIIMGADGAVVVDHINHNTLDNRRENLRVCSYKENNQNSRKDRTSACRFKGIYRHTKNDNWVAQIRVNGKVIHLGVYENEIAAAQAYDAAATKYHGEFACLNFPLS